MDILREPADSWSVTSSRISSRTAVVGILGLGYVGLPLALATAKAGFLTIGFDTDLDKPAKINGGESYIDAVKGEDLAGVVAEGRLRATSLFSDLVKCDVVIICVPTPLNRHREPDLSFVQSTAEVISRHLRHGQLVVLESTSYPGTTREVLKPTLEATGLVAGKDFFIGFSPEREDPGSLTHETATIPKVVAGDGPMAAALVNAFYSAVVRTIVPVSSPEVAEAAKITENVFRAVNIALVNELKMVFDRMGIDVWEVIDAAKTKPFGYMPFYPGPGLGGHCIPIDPFYLAWKSREYDVPTRFIELAGEINVSMPQYVIGKLEGALDRRLSKSLSMSKILVLGLAYKRNVSDVRESPSLKLIELLENRGAQVDFHDAHVSVIPRTREYPGLVGRRSVEVDPVGLRAYDAAIIATDHEGVNYGLVCSCVGVVVDTRNACARAGIVRDNIVKA